MKKRQRGKSPRLSLFFLAQADLLLILYSVFFIFLHLIALLCTDKIQLTLGAVSVHHIFQNLKPLIMFKKLTCWVVLLFLTGSLGAQQVHKPTQTHDHNGHGIDKCHTMEADRMLRGKFPELGTLSDFEKWLTPKVRAYKQDVAEGKNAKAILTVPIIFHIIHNGESVGSGSNIAATYVNAQLVQLNNDFRKIMGTSGHNSNPVGADTELQFCAALVDPNGNVLAEPGINRINRNT
ncbi:MAG: hypothetical protein KF852_10190 [Saprospiraceae bacterium]|nr:hypothetical protein [Saprospiraceae bacterium]